MEEGGQRLDRPRDAQLNKTFSKKRANPGSFMWSVPQLSNLDVSTYPMLQQCREKGTSKAKS
jgi:hypothetical protein